MTTNIALWLLQDGATTGAIYALLALALLLVFAVTRIIFVPQGDFISYAALTLATLQLGQLPGTVWLLASARPKGQAWIAWLSKGFFRPRTGVGSGSAKASLSLAGPSFFHLPYTVVWTRPSPGNPCFFRRLSSRRTSSLLSSTQCRHSTVMDHSASASSSSLRTCARP